MMNRRDILLMGLAGVLLASSSRFAIAQATEQQAYPMVFNPENYETLTTTITTDAGDRAVTYKFYKNVPYVAKPVDIAYQTMNVCVPIEIDGVAIDATKAPILLSNSVGGYMPSSVAEATGVDEKPMGEMPTGMGGGAPAAGEVASGGNAMMMGGERVSNAKYALASGFVVVEPGARGRTLTDDAGVYYGTAPAAIVDLKAAVRYLRANAGLVPGNMDWIVSSGTSAGGALSSLLGASGDDAMYQPYLDALGAAAGSDAVFATGAWCPITDLEHADMAYEWNWGSNPLQSGESVDAALSQELAGGFAGYQAGLGLKTPEGAALTADTYGNYLLSRYIRPEATTYLAALPDADRDTYLAENTHITWNGTEAVFDWPAFLAHVGARKKSAPSFDAFDLSTGENNLFGTGTTEARHFTTYGLRKATGDDTAELDADIPALVTAMNPMHFIAAKNERRSKNWWIRVGAKDSDTSLTVVGNLAAALENLGDKVDTRLYWDEGHGANTDPGAFMDWISELTGYSRA